VKHRLLILVLAALAASIGLAAGSAFSYWTSSGAGGGAAGVDTPQAVTVVAATGTPSSSLIPGGSADLVLQLDNPNGYPVRIIGISQQGSTVTPLGASGPGTACSTTTTGVTVPTRTGLSISVQAGSGQTVHIPNGVSMSTSSASGCQGATLQVPVNVVVQR
jgi:hypothetical protein